MKQRKGSVKIVTILALGILLLSANAFAADITFSGRTYVNGVQVSGVRVYIDAKFMSDSQERFKTVRYTAVSGSNGEYAVSFNRPAFYWPVSAKINAYSTPVYPYDYCHGARSVSMSMGANRRHVYVYCLALQESPEDY